MADPTIEQCAFNACITEVLAPKAGNVHPEAAFDDLTWQDFVTSAVVTAPLLGDAARRGVGATVLACVEQTRKAVGTNTNLGIILLLAPLCAAPRNEPLKSGIGRVLAGLSSDDAAAVYEAIRLARPGGMGKVKQADVRGTPPANLLDAMRLAADRDAVARQYVTAFVDVIGRIAPQLVEDVNDGMTLDMAIVHEHLRQMAHEPDSLIRRKCGLKVAEQSQHMAKEVLDNQMPFYDLDDWLRDPKHQRNPGTSADLIAAALFVAFRDDGVTSPYGWSQSLSSLA